MAVVVLAYGAFPGGIGLLAGRWCLVRRLERLYVLLAVLSALGTIYGLLRLTGLLLFDTDHRSSFLFWGSTWREVGIRWLFLSVPSLAGLLTVFWVRRRDVPRDEK